MRWRLRWAPAGVIAGLLVLAGQTGLASVNLPLHHWSYDAIERLVALGIIDRAMITAKPYSRRQAAKYVARAIEQIRADEIPADGRRVVAELLLRRLIAYLRPELIELGAITAPKPPAPQQRDRRNEASGSQRAGELESALSPSPSSRSSLSPAWLGRVRVGGRLRIEGDAFFLGHGRTRLRPNRMGQYYANGEQAQGDAWSWLQIGDAVALSADPKYISNKRALGTGVTSNIRDLYFQELNAKVTFGNTTFQIGRSNLWWGPGYHSTLLMSDHHFPLDMIQFGSEEPFQFPWLFRRLGAWKVNTFLTRLGSFTDQTGATHRARLFGARVSWLPVRWLEIGFTRLTQYGLNGQSFPGILASAYFNAPNQPFGKRKVHELAMVDFRATIPKVPYLVPFPAGAQLYGEVGANDKGLLTQYPLPSRGAVLGGLYIPQVYDGDTMDLRIEFADTDLARLRSGFSGLWYNNGTFLAGDRVRGFPIGSWIGTDAIDLFIRSTRYLTDSLLLGVNLDLWSQGRGRPVHESGREVDVDLTWWINQHVQWSFAYSYQRIQNPIQITNLNPYQQTFAAGVTSNNHLFSTNLAIEF